MLCNKKTAASPDSLANCCGNFCLPNVDELDVINVAVSLGAQEAERNRSRAVRARTLAEYTFENGFH